MFDIRLRIYSPTGTPGKILPAEDITFTHEGNNLSTIRFKISEVVAGMMTTPFVVALQYTVGSAWVEARNGRFIVKEDDTDAADVAGIVSFTGINLIGYLLGKNLLHWSSSAVNAERTWTDVSAGHMISTFIVEAKNRGWGSYVEKNWDLTTDSFGVPWPAGDKTTMSHRLLIPALQVLDALSRAGLVEWWSDGLEMVLAVPGTGVNRTNTVRLGPGAKTAPVKSNFDNVFTNLIVVPEKAWNWLYLTNPGASSAFGRLEASQSQDGIESHTVATRLAQPMLLGGKTANRQVSLQYEASSLENLPWHHYNVGDTVQAKLRGGWENLRVTEFIVKKESDGVVTVTTTLDHRFNGLMSKIANQVTAGSTGGNVGGAGGVPIPPSGGITVPPPKAPTGLAIVTNLGYFGLDGLPRADVTIAWDAVTMGVDDSLVTVDQYEVWVNVDGVEKRLTATGDLQATFRDLEPGRQVQFTVRAHGVGGWSESSGVLLVTPDLAIPATPKAPTGLTLESNVGYWSPGNSPYARAHIGWTAVTQNVDGGVINILDYEVWTSVNSGEYSLIAHVTNPDIDLDPLPPGATVGLRVYARSDLGVRSAVSTTLSFTAASPLVAVTAPTAPTVASGLGLVVATWDGKLVGNVTPGPSLANVSAEWATTSGGTYTRFGAPMTAAGSVTLSGRTKGSTVWVRLRATNRDGTTAVTAGVSKVVLGITGPDIEADTITANEIAAGTLTVNEVSPSFGNDLNISANGTITIIAGVAADAEAAASAAETAAGTAQTTAETAQTTAEGVAGAAQIAQQTAENAAATAAGATTTATDAQASAEDAAATATNAAGAADSAAQAAATAYGIALAAQLGADATSDALAAMQTFYNFGPDGAVISSPTSEFAVAIRNDRIEMLQNGGVVSRWSAGAMIVDQFIGIKVTVGNHQIEQAPDGTVVRAI